MFLTFNNPLLMKFNPNLSLIHNKDLSILTNLLHVKTIRKFQEIIFAYLNIKFER